MLKRIVLLLICGAILSCRSVSKSSSEPVQIRFRGEPGKESETRYANNSRILTYNDRQLVKDRTEGVDFTVLTKYQAPPQGGDVAYTSTTIEKDGVMELHDLAFPEKGEVIDYVIRSTGEVLKAGRFGPQSLFFVPSFPIPKESVSTGDTWTMSHVWNSAREEVPLKLEVVAILKGLVACEKASQCADIEISGHVDLGIPPSDPSSRFSSKLWGRLLFSLDRGDVIWSETRSREDMVHENERVAVTSCMVSELKTGKAYRLKSDCEPKEEPVTQIPSM
jgi:hypothetical protein